MRNRSPVAVFAWMLILWVSASTPLFAQAAKCDPAHPAELVVPIKIQAGQMRLDDARHAEKGMGFTDPSLISVCSKYPVEKLRTLLEQDLDKAFQASAMFYSYRYGSKTDAQIGDSLKRYPCLTGTNPWSKFRKDCVDQWLNDSKTPPPSGIQALRGGMFLNLYRNLRSIGALTQEAATPPGDFETGVYRFHVLAYGEHWSDRISDPIPYVDRRVLAEHLRYFDDGLWRLDFIKQTILDFYATRGLAPRLLFPPVKLPKLPSIQITPAAPISEVTFITPVPEGAIKGDVRRVLYLLLSTHEFELAEKLTIPEDPKKPGVYQTIPLPEPHLANSIADAAGLQTLKTLGYSVNAIDSTTEDKETLAVAKATDSAAVPKKRSAAQACKPVQVVSAEPENPADLKTADAECQISPPRDKKGFIGGGVDYVPGQAVRPIAELDYRISPTAHLSLTTGTSNTSLLGTGTASFDFVGFGGSLPVLGNHRLTVNLNGGTDATADRWVAGNKVNERRNGGTVYAKLELHNNPLGNSFYLYGEGGGETVTWTDPRLTGTSAELLNDQLTRVDLGGVYTLSRLAAGRPWRFRFEPAVRTGHANNHSYERATTIAKYHIDGLRRFSIDASARFEDASSGTPVYELPSFGDVTIMRGFHRDEFLGRRYWTLQPEVWTPLPARLDPSTRVGGFIANNVQLALFCDLGGVYQTYRAVPGFPAAGFKKGPGAGLRIKLNQQAILRLDWGYGIGRGPGGPSVGRFHFGATYALF